ncbi:YncE family protein [Tunturibacter empetritectus]|uniref:YVTN family beta-propeller protein n=1 Tax=Tunturiibacter lichenicola TaxID=2051959 RepID=A0A7W8J763_9BACT|nr:YncE family protein [Edaphobacter lichenicola]MBB5343751.1 YVTN family beta-propeller protein [Edaphobacter lichenicola]
MSLLLKSVPAFVLFSMLAAAQPSFAAVSPDAPFKLREVWKIGGDGSWDYMTVDSQAHILYVARLDRVMLVDTRTGKLITEISSLQHVHGVAFDEEGKVGYISDGGAGTVLVFDRATYKILATIPAGKNPDAVLFEPTQRRVFTFNGISHDATVIDAATNHVIATLPMPGKPEFSVTDGSGNVFVNIENGSAILRLDAKTLTITARWPLSPGEGPSGLAIDTEHHRLFSVCDNGKMAILDSQTGKLIASPTIGEGADAAVVDAAHNLIFSSNGESGTMSILRSSAFGGYSTFQTLPTKLGARTMAVDPSTGTVYTVSASLGPKPPASPANPKRRPAIVPGSFVIFVFSR